MAPTETELLRLGLLAYEAASEPGVWPRFLQLYNDAISSDATLIQLHDLHRNTSQISVVFGINSPLKQSYNEHYSKLNVWRNGGRSLYVPGAVNLDQEQCPRSLLERSEFYNDFLRRLGADHSMGAVLARRQNQVPTLTALRGGPKGPYGEEERRVAQFLLPYLSRAWALYERLELLEAGESVLENLPLGIVFLAVSGVMLYANRSADRILHAGDGFSLENGKPGSSERTADAQLRKAIAHALSPAVPPGPVGLTVPRRSFRHAYQVVVAPLRARFPQFNGTPVPRAVIFINDPDCSRPANLGLLVQLFGLTPKEADIASKLSEAKSIEQAAEEMGITYETARTHLRRIFSKTGVSRQTELVLMMARLPRPELE